MLENGWWRNASLTSSGVKTSGTLIDHLYSNNLLNALTPHVLITDISDHFPTLLLIDKTKRVPTQEKQILHKRDMHNFDTEEFLIDLDKTVCRMNESQSHETSKHEKCKYFIDSFTDVVNNQ